MMELMTSEPMTPGQRRRRAWDLSVPAPAEPKPQRARPPKEPSVYLVRLGKFVKIGFSTNVTQRLRSFETTSTDVELLLVVPGDIRLERRIHALLSEVRVQRELFHRDWRVTGFINRCRSDGLASAIEYLEQTTPRRRGEAKQRDRSIRVARERADRASKDAGFAALVAERKKRLGW